MLDKDNFLLKYFFLYGVPEEVKNDLKINGLKEQNNISPVVLSSYSVEGDNELFNALKSKLNEDNYLKNNIFPIQENYLCDVNFPLDVLESPTLTIKSNPFNQYIDSSSSFENMPQPFNHCFQYIFKLDETKEDSVILNFTVLIFYENVADVKDRYEEQLNKSLLSSFLFPISKYFNIFIGKALILVSEKPIFSLMREILRYVFNKYIHKKYTYFPIEQLIINCFEKINGNNSKENSGMTKYKIYKEPILPYCDLNISFFLDIFKLEDIFNIAEYYLCSKNIIISSTNVEYLFPIYYILMTLFFPLNKNSNERFYKLVIPDQENLQRTLFGSIAQTFQFIYKDEKMDKEILKKICRIKGDILIYQIYEDENDNYKIKIFKNIIKYDEENDNFTEIDLTKVKYDTIIEKVCNLKQDLYKDLIQSLKNDIQIINREYDENKSNIKYPHFFDFSFDYSKYDSLRIHFTTLFINFFVIALHPITFKLVDNKIEIDIIEFVQFENDPDANELLSTLYTTPQSDLIYKNGIIKNGKFDTRSLKQIILLDYFMKISFGNKNKSYFKPKSPNEKNKFKYKNKNLDLKDLFNYSNILNSDSKNIYYYINRLYLYTLKNACNQNINFEIEQAKNFSEYLQFYQKLTDDETIYKKDIDEFENKRALNYVIFYGEKFGLHFGQFVSKNIYDLNNNDDSSLDGDIIDQNNIYEKYYKVILDETEIFHGLLITQIIPIENKEQLAACAIGLYVSIYLINLLSELSTKNPYKNKLLEIIKRNKVKLLKLFNITKGFYGKYDLLINFLYIIFSNRQFNKGYKEYTDSLIQRLEKEKIMPPIITILMHNHDISLDFKVIKNSTEKNNRNKKYTSNDFDRKKTYIDSRKRSIKKKRAIVTKSYINKNAIYINYEPIKEILIYNIERNNHEHEYNIMNGINDNYNCENKDCKINLNFTIQQNKNGRQNIEYVENPRNIINKILKKILMKKSLFIHSYNDVNEINQIAMLDELYFKIGFFKEQQ